MGNRGPWRVQRRYALEETDGLQGVAHAAFSFRSAAVTPIAEQALTVPGVREKHGFPVKKTLIAVNAESGKTLWIWSPEGDPLPLTLASDGGNAYIRTDVGVICLDMTSGKETWRHSGGQPAQRRTISYAANNLVVVDGVVLCNLDATLIALSASDGKKLWECNAGTSFHEPVDLFVIDGLAWHKVSHKADPMRVHPDQREARDLHTGELKVRDAVPLRLLTPGHHFRCYRAKATENFIIMGKRGAEMVDLSGNDHSRYHLEDQQQPSPYRSDQPIGLMLVHKEKTVWGVQRGRRGEEGYSLFRKALDGSSEVESWKMDLSVRPSALLKSGDMLFLGVMPTDIPADDPHAAHDGRLGGSIWVCSEKDGAKVAEYALPSPVNWDGMAAAGGRLYLSTADGRLICMASVQCVSVARGFREGRGSMAAPTEPLGQTFPGRMPTAHPCSSGLGQPVEAEIHCRPTPSCCGRWKNKNRTATG